MIENLRRSGWIDHYTRAVFAEFNTFNSGTGLANLAVILAELPPTGDILWSWRIESLQLYNFSGLLLGFFFRFLFFLSKVKLTIFWFLRVFSYFFNFKWTAYITSKYKE